MRIRATAICLRDLLARIVFLAVVLSGLVTFDATAQTNVGIGTASPDSSAILDVSSSEKGFLPPRMTEAQRDLINSPAIGLLLYNTDSDCYNYYDGTTWLSLCQTFEELSLGCPFGFISVNDNFCIEWEVRPPATWFDAVEDCLEDNLRLCTWGEWYGACKQAQDGQILSMQDGLTNLEWTSTGGGTGSLKRAGNGSCDNRTTSNPTIFSYYRCCLDKVSRKEGSALPTDTACRNLALLRPVAVSNTGVFQPAFGVDGVIGTLWHSGGYPPQWIRIALAAPSDVYQIRWHPAQIPPSTVTQEFYGTQDGVNWVPLRSISFFQLARTWYDVSFNPPLEGIVGIELRTTSSASHVGFWEVEVLGCD